MYVFQYQKGKNEEWHLERCSSRQWRFYRETKEIRVEAFQWEEIVEAVKRQRKGLIRIDYKNNR